MIHNNNKSGFVLLGQRPLLQKILAIIVLFFINNIASAQISGYILSKTNEPIPYVSIIKSNYSTGSYTNQEGYFEINDVQMDDTLWITHIGYKDTIIILSNQRNIKLFLDDSSFSLKEIIITSKIKKVRKIKHKSRYLDHTNLVSKIGIWAKPNKQDTSLVGVDFFISKGDNPTAPFRVGILKNINNDFVLQDDYIFEGQINKGNKWVNINFEKPLEVQDSVLIYIELLKKKNPKPNKEPQFLGISLGMAEYEKKRMIWVNHNNTGWMKLEMLYDFKYQLMIEPIFEE